MRAVPHKIIDKEFKKAVRGYAVGEVDDFLDEIAEDFESLYRENGDLRNKLDDAHEKMERYVTMEKSIQGTLVLAQNTADTAKAQAEKEAELIVRTAQDRANRIVEDASLEQQKLLRENDKIRTEFTGFKRRILNFMEGQTESFKTISVDIEKSSLTGALNMKNSLKRDDENLRAMDFSRNISDDSMDNTKCFDVKSIFDAETVQG